MSEQGAGDFIAKWRARWPEWAIAEAFLPAVQREPAQAWLALLQELGREATHAEIADGMDITEEEVAKTMSISQAHLSLDAPLSPGEDNKLLDYLPDNLNPTPDEQTFEKALTESIEEALGSLKEREAKILRLYFGLDGSEPMTLEEIGALLGITRERVRQIKEKALSRLRHVSRARALESFLG